MTAGKGKNLLWRLLRKHVSPLQLAGFSIASLVGLTIVVLALQFYVDVKPVFSDEDSFARRDYIVVTKHVSGLGSMFGTGVEFSESEIADLESQPWVREVGRFTTSEYGIYASVMFGGRGLRTQLFFESVPDKFIDELPEDWGFDPANPKVPVILSRDYLSLYNFGFATTQGMPKISEGMIGMVPVSLALSGNGDRQVVEGRIVGFSNRLNTIIVPESFMQWSNEKFGDGSAKQPSRLIVEVSKPGDVAIGEYMDAHGYEIGGDKADSGKASYFLNVTIGIVVAVGALISLLSFFVLMLSIYLLLQKNTRKLQDLLMRGYTPRQVSSPYVKLVVAVNCIVLAVACIAVAVCRACYLPILEAFDVSGGEIWLPIVVAVVVMGAITLGNIMAIRRRVASLWHQ